MRFFRPAVLAAALAWLVPTTGRAEPMDPALERLVLDPNCRDDAGRFLDGNPSGLEDGPGGRAWCVPDDVAFKKLVNQYGFAFAPSAMHAARTPGYGGFQFTLEAGYTKISNGAEYWKQGTQGPIDPATNRASTRNGSPQSMLQLYSLNLRKGFGFGLEVAGNVGFMPKTSIISGGADVRIALLEGMRTGVMGFVPDLAVGGGVRTITGTPQMQLTVASLDAQISKPIAVGDSSVISPWIGYQKLWIFGDSGLIDLTPGTDAQGYCGYAGPNLPGNPDNLPGDDNPKLDEDGNPIYDGEPVCANPNPRGQLDFNNNVVFDRVRLDRHRILFGFNYRYEMVKGGLQFITDLMSPSDAQSDGENSTDLEGEESQWTVVIDLGVAF